MENPPEKSDRDKAKFVEKGHSSLKKFEDDNFDREVLQEKGLTIVFFYASWDTGSKAMAPHLAKLSDVYDGDVKVGRMDTDENHKTSQTYDIRAVPAICFFRGGKLVDKDIGYQSYFSLEAKIKSLLES